MSRVTRYLAQIGYWIALAAIPPLTLGSAQRIVAQTTIVVTTTQQGVTDPSNCSLQEALTATPIIFTNITIQGNGATLEWTGTGNSRLFAVGSATIFDSLDNKTVSGTGVLTLESVYIKGFRIKGGDGTCGGGGGLGAGGAIYVGGDFEHV